jgi:hypothetical protein
MVRAALLSSVCCGFESYLGHMGSNWNGGDKPTSTWVTVVLALIVIGLLIWGIVEGSN